MKITAAVDMSVEMHFNKGGCDTLTLSQVAKEAMQEAENRLRGMLEKMEGGRRITVRGVTLLLEPTMEEVKDVR